MVVNLLGECDKRPVLYTLIKMFQNMGDLLVVSDDKKIMRLADDTGHYQNVMIAYTEDGIDDFFLDFPYNMSDFEWVIICNTVTADADLYLYVKALLPSEDEKDSLEYLEKYETIELFSHGIIDKTTMLRVEEFESYKNMPPMSPGVIKAVASIMCKYIKKDAEGLAAIARVSYPPPAEAKKEKASTLPKLNFKKKGGK